MHTQSAWGDPDAVKMCLEKPDHEHPSADDAMLVEDNPEPPEPSFTVWNRYIRGLHRLMLQLPICDSFDVTVLCDLCTWRAEVLAKRKDRGPDVWIAVYGFGKDTKKKLTVRALRYALCPGVLYGSSTGDDRWEALLLLNRWSPCVHEIETLCAKFRMSVGVIELGTYLGPSMLSCYERIKKGRAQFGNILTARNRHHHQNLDAFLLRKTETERLISIEQDMGMNFTIRNMQHVVRQLRNTEIEVADTQRQVAAARRHLVDVISSARVATSLIENAAVSNQMATRGVYDSSAPDAHGVAHTHMQEVLQSMNNIDGILSRVANTVSVDAVDASNVNVLRWSTFVVNID